MSHAVSPFLWDWLTVFESKSRAVFCGGGCHNFCDAQGDCFILWRKSSFSNLFVFVKDRYLSLDFASSISEREGEKRGGEGECEFSTNLTCTCYTFWGGGGKLASFWLIYWKSDKIVICSHMFVCLDYIALLVQLCWYSGKAWLAEKKMHWLLSGALWLVDQFM